MSEMIDKILIRLNQVFTEDKMETASLLLLKKCSHQKTKRSAKKFRLKVLTAQVQNKQ
jgi:hypothetical protein